MKLCYKEYPVKMTLAGIRDFKRETGKDLWCTLLSLISVFVKNEKSSDLDRMRALYEAVDFETASHAFKAIIHFDDRRIGLDEIQDAMFRVGWRPLDEDGSEWMEPWPIVLVAAAFEIDSHFKDVVEAKKKEAISAR